MPLRKVYVRYREELPENSSVFAAQEGFRQLGTETVPFYGFGDVEGLRDVGPEVGLCGFVGDVLQALAVAGVPRPPPLDYPDELLRFLGRGLRRSTLQAVRDSADRVFVKPVEHKLFTGFVWTRSATDRYRVAIHPSPTPVWVSDPVEFVSEHRCFVLAGEILDVRRYKGDWWRSPDRSVVEEAVSCYRGAPRAFAADFGVDSSGRTLLVEVNDAFALGAYGLPSVPYARMVEARWEELAGGVVSPGEVR